MNPLEELLEQVSRGKAFVITRRGKPVADLMPHVQTVGVKTWLGAYEGKIKVLPGFDEPLDDFKDYV